MTDEKTDSFQGSGQDEEPANIPRHVSQEYEARLSFLKKGKDFSVKGDVITGIAYYHKYLNCLAAYLSVDEKKLSPSLFDKQKNMREMLLISNVYWDLAKCYDRNPKTHLESARCLNQFLKFTLGFKYQYLNAQLLRRYIKKKHPLNKKNFEECYKRLRMESKGCYVASFCYGENHIVTNRLRIFKLSLLKYQCGENFVDLYYQFSPCLVNFLEKHFIIGSIVKLTTRPPLRLLSLFFKES